MLQVFERWSSAVPGQVKPIELFESGVIRMSRIIVRSKVGSDGLLHLPLPAGLADAGDDVQVTIETLPYQDHTPMEWKSWVEGMAGSWHGDFERPPQGECEVRESLT